MSNSKLATYTGLTYTPDWLQCLEEFGKENFTICASSHKVLEALKKRSKSPLIKKIHVWKIESESGEPEVKLMIMMANDVVTFVMKNDTYLPSMLQVGKLRDVKDYTCYFGNGESEKITMPIQYLPLVNYYFRTNFSFELRTEMERFYYDDNVRYSIRVDKDKIVWSKGVDVTEYRIPMPSFHFLTLIGRGRYAKVYLTFNLKDKRTYAVKVINKAASFDSFDGTDKKEELNLVLERNVLLAVSDHPFFPQLHYAFQTPLSGFFIMDCLLGGDFHNHLQKHRGLVSEDMCQFYAAELALAIGHLHSKKIMHRDLRLENIMLDSDGHVMLIDFGSCYENTPSTGVRTPLHSTHQYLAPEILNSKPYTMATDWWSFGIIAHEMLYGSLPRFEFDRVTTFPVEGPYLMEGQSEAAEDFISRLLELADVHRLGYMQDFKEVKSHPFFKNIRWGDIFYKRIQPPIQPARKQIRMDSTDFSTDVPFAIIRDCQAGLKALHDDKNPDTDELSFKAMMHYHLPQCGQRLWWPRRYARAEE